MRMICGLTLLTVGMLETAYVALVPWSYIALVATVMLVIGGLLLTVNFTARIGSKIASTGAVLGTILAACSIVVALYRTDWKNPLAYIHEKMIYFGILIALVLFVDYMSYWAVTITRARHRI